jgi:hypothetical protein
MSEELAAGIIRRAEKAFRRLELFREIYQRAFRLGFPERDGWYASTEGTRRHREIYDSNYADSWERLANAIYTGMCPPWAAWHQLTPGSEVPKEKQDEVLTLLQPHSRAIRVALSQSNYYTELHSTITDLIAGTGHLLTDEHPKKGLVFRATPIHEVGLEADSFGITARFWRRKVAARDLKKEFPEAILPSDLDAQVRDRPDEDVEILSATLEHENPRYEAIQYVLHEKSKRILTERNFFEQPWSNPRWSVLSGEVHGRGPALKAEPGAYSTNEAAKLMLMAANISLFGMWLVDSDRINPDNIELGAAAMIPVKGDGTSVEAAMRPLVPSTNFDVARFSIEDLRAQTKRGFYRDNLGSIERPGMTATEVIERQALVAQDMGAAYGRMTHELLQPVLKRVSGILARAGKMPPEIKIDGRVVGVQYTSALARAQQYEEVVGMRAFAQDVLVLSQIDPSAKFSLNANAYARKMAGLTGVDLDITRTEPQVRALLQQQAEGQAALMQGGALEPKDSLAGAVPAGAAA